VNIEFLECRLLLTGAYTTYNAAAKKLSIAAPGTNDVIAISLSNGHTLSVTVNGVNDYNLGSGDSAAVLILIDIQAGNGNDSINLGTTSKAILTATTINGGNGADTIIGGAGPDEIFGGNGDDSIDGNLGADSISGGANNDTVSYATRGTAVSVNLDLLANDGAAGEGDWIGSGTTDVESIMGGSGNDTLTGNGLGNYISGGAGTDMIHGQDGSDTIVGGAGGDSLYGDNDADFIFAKDGEFDVIDGGPGIDAADVDNSPVEAPLPGPLAADAVTSTENTTPVAALMGPVLPSVTKPSIVFSTRRVSRRQIAAQELIAKVFKPVTSGASSTPTAPAPAPLPAPPDNGTETKIDSNNLPGILQPMAPYCQGQALTFRDSQGTVHSDGTDTDDQFIVQTIAGTAGVNVTNNGGFTEWPLPSPTVLLNGMGGSNALDVMGTNVVYAPGAPGTPGMIMSDGHAILFNGIDPEQISFSNVGNLTIVTPGSNDFLHLGVLSTADVTELDGQSDGQSIGTILLNNVQLLTIDCGAHDDAVNANDLLTVDGVSSTGPAVAFMPGAFGSDTITVNQPGFVLANDPTVTPGQPTVTLNVNPQGGVTFTAPFTRLAHINLAGHIDILAGGDKSLHPGGVNMLGGTLDINDNSLVIDTPGGVFQQNAGVTNLGGGTLVVSTVDLEGGTLAGNGAITGSLFNAGTVAPGFSPGSLSISGDYTQAATGTLEVEIGGNTAGTDFDQLQVGGNANLAGTLSVSLIDGFVPASPDKFPIITYAGNVGDFSTISGLAFQGGVLKPLANPLKYILDANLAPVAETDSVNTIEDTPVSIQVLTNDSDPDDTDANPDVDPPTIDTFTQPAHGTVNKIGGVFNYTPFADFNGADSFTYTLRDAADNTATATVTVSITAVNDAPILLLSKPSAAVDENAGPQRLSIINDAQSGPSTAADESNQVLSFDVQVINVTGNLAFSAAPMIDPVTGELTFTTAPDTHGTANLAIRLMDDGGTANGGADTSAARFFTLTVNAVPPRVLSSAYIHQNPANPFAGNYLRVRFSEPVSLSLADITVNNNTTNQEVTPASLQYITANNTAIITLPGTPADGNYTLTLHSAGIADTGGTSLDGDGDGQPGGDYLFSFFHLRGDVNLDRTVGFADLVAVAQHYGGTALPYADGDITGDGEVGFPDLVAVAQNYGKTLDTPAPGVAVQG
jgi:Ca2+-binding RTX toxin-like protein